jgi:pectate lyase
MKRSWPKQARLIPIALICLVIFVVLLFAQFTDSSKQPTYTTETSIPTTSTVGSAETPILSAPTVGSTETHVVQEPLAFPGAEGFGSKTPGGRGGRVIEVTNLNDSGPGSLRAALEKKVPRIIVFKTGGTIEIEKNLTISSPYITLAGQTAPGDGIAIKGASVVIATHDVIIRNLRIRRGPGRAGDNLWVRSESSNIIIDHCSLTWATDEQASITENSRNVTLSWSIIAEGLYDSTNPEGPHSMGTLTNSTQNVSIHHNLYAHNDKRNPKMAGDTHTEVINNVVYNWKSLPTLVSTQGEEGPAFGNIINNFYKQGPDDIGVKPILFLDTTDPASRFYITGNSEAGEVPASQDNWALAAGASPDFRSMTPVLKPSGVTIDPTDVVFDRVLNGVGAISPQRDTADQRIVQSVRDSAGKIINDPSEVGGWPQLAPGTPAQDSDHDGMPDTWETAKDLDPNQDDSAQDRDGDGYTNIEEYINGLMLQ